MLTEQKYIYAAVKAETAMFLSEERNMLPTVVPTVETAETEEVSIL